MFERLVDYNIRAIDEKWIRRALEDDGLKKLDDIIYTALDYRDEAEAEAEQEAKKVEPVPSQSIAQEAQGPTYFREVKRTIGELWSLCNDPNPLKRVRVAESSQAIPAMLSQLASDPKEFIREAVGGNTQVSIETLELLSRDSAAKVRVRIASNPRTPFSILERLVGDSDPEVSSAAAIQQDKPRKFIASNSFYSIGMTKDEEIHPDVILLDANVVLLLEEWARGTNKSVGFGDLNESVKPLLKILRETKFASFEQGALESSWPSPKKEVSHAEKLVIYNHSRMTDLINLVDYLRTGSKQDFESWTSSNRTESLKWGNGVPNDFNFERSKPRILEAWWLSCLLIKHILIMEENEGTSNIHDIQIGIRIRYFKNYLDEIIQLGMSLEGEMLFLARMGFFGGRIRFGTRSFDFADITKKNEWSRRGILAIGRNIAMDVALIRIARELRLSRGQQGTLRTSIITGDLGLLAVFQYVQKEWRDESSGRLHVQYEWPPESEIFVDPRPFHGFNIFSDPNDDRSETKSHDWIARELLLFSE